MLELSLNTLPKGDIRDNFQKILEGFQSLVLESGNWRFYEIVFTKAITDYKFKHNFMFAPKDVIQTAIFGPGQAYFNYDDFDKTNISITTSDACTVRFFLGLRSESVTLGQTGSIGGTGGGSGGSGNLLVVDTNSIDLTFGSSSLSADLRLSTTLASTGYFKVTTTIKSGGSPGLHVEVPIATSSLTGVLSAADWVTFNAKLSSSNIDGGDADAVYLPGQILNAGGA